MKFTTLLLSLASTSYVYSMIPSFNHKSGLYLVDSTNKFLSTLTEDCRKDLEKDNVYADCAGSEGVDKSNIDEKCKLFNSKKCIDYYKDPLAVAPKCANDEVFKKEMLYYENFDPTKIDSCLRIAEGKFCPIPENSLNGLPITDDTLLATCKSKACIENSIYLFEQSIKNAEITASIHQELASSEGSFINAEYTKRQLGQYVDFLKSENCTSQAEDDLAIAKFVGVVDAESSATIIKTSSVLFTTLGLLLYYFL